MTNYTKTTNFATKDSLPSGNANKIVKGTEIDTEFNNIATALATKADTAGPTFTGTVTIPTADINGGAIDGTTIGAASASSIIGTTIVANTSINIAGDGATVTGIKDEDDMSSNSATKLATQQSIKAYVDSQVTAQDLDVTDGSSSIDIDLDSESLGILGGTGIDSTASGTGVTLAIDSTVATLTGSQTLTNKTLTAPTLTGTAVVASLDISGDIDVDGTLETDALSINGTTVTSTAAELNILDGVTSTAAELNILDGVTSTTAELNILDGVTATTAELNILDGKAFLDEDDMSSNSATGIASQQSIKAYVDAQITAEDLDFQADSGGALSIDLDSETLTFTGGTGIDTSGSGNAVTFAIDSTVATLTGTQTLTNKTLTSPDINTPDIDGGTIDNTVIGGSTAAAGTFTTVSATNVSLPDDGILSLGDSDELTLKHHNSGYSHLINTTGTLFIDSDSVTFRDDDDGSPTNVLINQSGIDVTGSVTTDGLTVDGTSTFSPNSGTLDIKVGTHDATNNVRLNAGGTTSTYLEYRGYLGHIFDVDTTRMMTLTSTGLGISTSNPDQLLQVGSETYAANAIIKTQVEGSDTGNFDAGLHMRSHNDDFGGSIVLESRAGINDIINFKYHNNSSAGVSAMAIDATNGNVGMGLTPHNWAVGRALELGFEGNALWGNAADEVIVVQNGYYDGAWKYATTRKATHYSQYDGTHRWFYAPSGTADSAITWATAMTIDNSANLGIGTDSPANYSNYNTATIGADTTGSILQLNGSTSGHYHLVQNNNGAMLISADAGDAVGSTAIIFQVDGGEAARIDSSGNLLVGTTNANPTSSSVNDAGVELSNTGGVRSTVASNPAATFNRKTNDGVIALFRKDGSTVGSIGSQPGSILQIISEGTELYVGTSGTAESFFDAQGGVAFSVFTTHDGSSDLGRSNARFDDIFATNATIQTSDRNEKQDIEALSDAEQRVAVAAKGLLRKYRWKSAVEEKGDDARIHFGIIAQDLQDAFTAEGLDAARYAMFCSDTWTDEETGEERTRLGVRYSELLAFIISAI